MIVGDNITYPDFGCCLSPFVLQEKKHFNRSRTLYNHTEVSVAEKSTPFGARHGQGLIYITLNPKCKKIVFRVKLPIVENRSKAFIKSVKLNSETERLLARNNPLNIMEPLDFTNRRSLLSTSIPSGQKKTRFPGDLL